MKMFHQGSSLSRSVVRRPGLLRRAAAAACAVALGALLLFGPAAHAGDGGGKPVGPGKFKPINACVQACFDQYLENHAACRRVFCDTFLFITIYCDEPGLAACKVNAEMVLDDCLAHCYGVTA